MGGGLSGYRCWSLCQVEWAVVVCGGGCQAIDIDLDASIQYCSSSLTESIKCPKFDQLWNTILEIDNYRHCYYISSSNSHEGSIIKRFNINSFKKMFNHANVHAVNALNMILSQLINSVLLLGMRTLLLELGSFIMILIYCN